MSIRSPHIAARLFGAPLLIAPDKLAAMVAGLGGRIVDGGVVLINHGGTTDHVAFAGGRPSMGVLDGDLSARLERNRIAAYPVVENVAVIGIEGSLVQKGAYLGQSSGETSYQGLQVQIARARADAQAGRLKGVVFETDSLGGEVSGAFETADAIHELSQIIPTMAVLTDAAASGGYLLASQCRQIAMPKSGQAGSIGVVSLHLDMSGKMEKDGVRATLITAGEHKADGNPFEPLADEFRAGIQARNEATRQQFAEVVARGRKGRITQAQALATEARTYFDQKAVDVGLVDVIAPAQAAFSAFVKAVNPAA